MNMPRSALQRLVGPIVVVVAIGVAGWLVMRGGGGESSASGDGEAVVTVPVERRVLEALQVTRGTVLAPSQATVVAGAPGEGELAVVVTGLPVALGGEVTAGGVAAEINGRPVFALPGDIPVYRDMRPGDVGPDVAAVQDALRALGYSVAEAERAAETFGYSTQSAVRTLYENAGYGPVYTLGSRDAVAEAESEANDAVDAARAALDGATAAASPDDAAVGSVGDGPAPSDAVASAQSALDDAVAARNRVQAAEGVTLPAREFVAVPSLPASIVELPVPVGENVDPGMPVATIGSNEFRVRIELTSAQVNELADEVEIAVFSDRGYEAICSAVEPRAETAAGDEGRTDDETSSAAEAGDTPDEDASAGETGGGSSGGATSPDAYVMDVVCDPLPPADSLGTSLRVTMTVRRSDGEVLVVPATAVTTTPSGDVSVEVIDAGGESAPVEVTMGSEADGFVEVTPVDDGALAEGMDVRVRRS